MERNDCKFETEAGDHDDHAEDVYIPRDLYDSLIEFGSHQSPHCTEIGGARSAVDHAHSVQKNGRGDGAENQVLQSGF